MRFASTQQVARVLEVAFPTSVAYAERDIRYSILETNPTFHKACTMALVSVACADYGSSSGVFYRDEFSRVQSGLSCSFPLFSDL